MSKNNYRLEELEKLVSLAKRRGIIFPSSEIYGGLSSVWDYGPIGVEIKRNVKNLWWKSFVSERDDIFGIDASIFFYRIPGCNLCQFPLNLLAEIFHLV